MSQFQRYQELEQKLKKTRFICTARGTALFPKWLAYILAMALVLWLGKSLPLCGFLFTVILLFFLANLYDWLSVRADLITLRRQGYQ